MCSGATGRMSSNARTWSFSRTILAGICARHDVAEEAAGDMARRAYRVRFDSSMCGRTALTASPGGSSRTSSASTETPTAGAPLQRAAVAARRRRARPARRAGVSSSSCAGGSSPRGPTTRRSATSSRSRASRPSPPRQPSATRSGGGVPRRRSTASTSGRREGKPSSQPFFVRRPDGAPFALAGVWDRWVVEGRGGDRVVRHPHPGRRVLPSTPCTTGCPWCSRREAWDPWLDLDGTDGRSRSLAPRSERPSWWPIR